MFPVLSKSDDTFIHIDDPCVGLQQVDKLACSILSLCLRGYGIVVDRDWSQLSVRYIELCA